MGDGTEDGTQPLAHIHVWVVALIPFYRCACGLTAVRVTRAENN